MKYRADIDGLRAVAVLGVLLFHAGVKGVSGGFVGVDVFFVISGFLITGIIVDELDRGVFSFKDFYERRARRLFPALFVTLVLSFVAGYYILSPTHFEKFGQSLIYSILSLSNLYFWGESGYFDDEGKYKPLLHTWSLSVEEQFYLVWPAILVGLYMLRHRWILVAFVSGSGLASIFAAEHWLKIDPSGVFYLSPFRAGEFAVGALCVWVFKWIPQPVWFVREALSIVGASLVLYSMIFYSSEIVFPGFSAIVPCVGAAFLIYGGQNTYVGRFLAGGLFVGVGKISYSLYLVHWPLLVYYSYWKFSALTDIERLLLVVASVIFATIMYFVVETPLRRRSRKVVGCSASRFGFASVSSALFLVVLGANAWGSRGWDSRLPDAFRMSQDQLQKERGRYWGGMPKTGFGDVSGNKIVIIGDSHAIDLFYSMYYAGQRNVVFKHTMHYCEQMKRNARDVEAGKDVKGKCAEDWDKIVASKEVAAADYVLLIEDWEATNDYQVLEGALGDIERNTNARVVVFGPKMKYRENVVDILAKYGRQNAADKFAVQFQESSRYEVSGRLKNIAVGAGVEFVDTLSIQCPERLCPVLDESGKIAYFDKSHWTDEGARQFSRRLIEQKSGVVAELFDSELGVAGASAKSN